ncbi:MAG: DUF5660 domain-containing protein [bacterium]|nr:DUF5660 domain-containing protein [bacterium]
MATPSKGRRPAPANFIEALSGLTKGVGEEAKIQITKAIVEDIPQAFGFSGTLKPNESFSISDLEAAERRGERKATARFSNRLEQERMVFLRSENEKHAQINQILAEIAQLARSIKELNKEVQVATMQAPVNPGVYHRNFFAQLRSFIIDIRQRVTESRHWLATTNSRASKRKGFFWGQAQKSGTKFLLSQERYMVTTTG